MILGDRQFHLDSTEGLKALKRNWFDSRLAEEVEAGGTSSASEGITAPLFKPDSPRRMLLIQEKISGLRD